MKEIKPWYFLPTNEIPEGFVYPQAYLDFIRDTGSLNKAMTGLFPWVFVGEYVWAKTKSKETFGVELVPFAQAEDLDMMAYFEASNQQEPKIWVCDPWESIPELRVYKVLDNFEDWLSYAKEISDNELEQKPHFRNDEFWFPKSA